MVVEWVVSQSAGGGNPPGGGACDALWRWSYILLHYNLERYGFV